MKLFQQGRQKYNRLILSVLSSLVLHCLAIAIVQKYSVWHYAYSRLINLATTQETIDRSSTKKHLLKTTFKQNPQSQASSYQASNPQKELLKENLKDTFLESVVEEESSTQGFHLGKILQQYGSEHLIIGMLDHPGNAIQGSMQDWAHPKLYERLKELSQDSSDLLRYEVTPSTIPKIQSKIEASGEVQFSVQSDFERLDTQLEILDIQPIQLSNTQPDYHPVLQGVSEKMIPMEKLVAHLPLLPNLKSLKTRSISECFVTDVAYTKSTTSDEYIFAVTLIPNPNVQFNKLRQNYYFLIDRNNSIQAKRLHATSNAVMRAISCIPKEDHFNIITYDSKIEKFSSLPQPAKSSNIKRAKHFLMNTKIASFFTESKLFKTLRTLSMDDKNEEDLNTVILLTDGETLLNRHKDMFTVAHWLGLNQKKYSLFCLSLKNDKNIPLLNLLTEMSQGKLHLAQNKKAIKRKLVKLVQSIESPIATQVTSSAVAIAPDSVIKLYPSNERLSNLYQSTPFVLIGTTKKLEDFILFIQGKHKNEWLNLKKTISFKNAKNVGENLEQQWALQESFDLFESFMADGNPLKLQKATNLLNDKKISSPFPK